MVHLILSSTKGNQGLRYFPYTGYLGLTPVTVEGLVRTRLDADNKPLLATSITISVRCYELRIGRVNVANSNVLFDHTQTLWQASPSKSSMTSANGEPCEAIDNLEFPFRVSLPTHTKGFSTTVFVDYRCSWRIEAVLNHIPIAGIGSRQIKHFELPLVRYDVPPSPIPSSPSTSSFTHAHKPTRLQPHQLTHQSLSRKGPRIRYTFSPPTEPIGPSDIVSIPIWLLPVEGRDDFTVKSATLVIERRIQINDHPTTTPPHTPKSSSRPIPPSPKSKQRSSPLPSRSPSPSPSGSFQDRVDIGTTTISSEGSSNPTITPYSIYPSTASVSSSTRPLLPSTTGSSSSLSAAFPDPSTFPIPPSPADGTFIASKTIRNAIVGAESTGAFNKDAETGIWSKTVTMQWPAARSHSRWAIGETIVGAGTGGAVDFREAGTGGGVSDLANVRFYVRVKVSVSSSGGSETIELAEKELLIVSTNEAERKLALAKYAELSNPDGVYASTRSKSKSPRRTKRERDNTGDALTGDEDLIPPPPPLKNKVGKGSSSAGSVTGAANGEGNVVAAGHRTKKSSKPRRPHTSAGPRDQTGYLYFAMGTPVADNHVLQSQPVGQSQNGEPREKKRRSGMVGSFFSSASAALKDPVVAPRMSSAQSGSSTGTSGTGTTRSTSSNTSMSSSSSYSHGSSRMKGVDTEVHREFKEREQELQQQKANIEEWEMELAKIEQVSQKKTIDLFSGLSFGRWGRKKDKS